MISKKDVEDVVDDVWTVNENKSSGISVDRSSPSATVDVSVENPTPASHLASLTQNVEWKGENVPFPLFYAHARTKDALLTALENAFEDLSQTHPDNWSQVSGDVPSLETVIHRLQEQGATYITAHEIPLAHGHLQLEYAAEPYIGTNYSFGESLSSINLVEFNDTPLALPQPVPRPSDVGPHFHQRVPLYVEKSSHWELNRVSMEEGLNHARTFIESGKPHVPTETASLEKVVSQLVDAGAIAVCVDESLSNGDQMAIVAYLPPNTGYETVGSIKSVTVDGDEYEVEWLFRWSDGPHFSKRIPLYSSESIRGLESVSVPDGLDKARAYVAQT